MSDFQQVWEAVVQRERQRIEIMLSYGKEIAKTTAIPTSAVWRLAGGIVAARRDFTRGLNDSLRGR